MFMLSTKEVTIAAMRRGRDGMLSECQHKFHQVTALVDVMMFLNVAVAMTCLAFCWVLCIVGFKGWVRMRASSSTVYGATP